MAVVETKEKEKVDAYYVRTPMPSVVEQSIIEYFHEHDDFIVAEILQDQETVYQSLQKNPQNDRPRASSPADTRSNHNNGQSREEGNSSASLSVVSQLAMDEALARELQELEDQLSRSSLGGSTEINDGNDYGLAVYARKKYYDANTTESPIVNVEGTSSNTSTQVARQDRVDPDSMTYEELQSLGEAVGTECRGLSDELISYLCSSTYKTGLFSKREKEHECVICCMPYKNKQKLITLPCQHQYHKTCVTQWLKIKKVCPVCNEEVFGS